MYAGFVAKISDIFPCKYYSPILIVIISRILAYNQPNPASCSREPGFCLQKIKRIASAKITKIAESKPHIIK